jgi:nitroimidazol reductase NimA-like FMN-containing flavoprotein (pyridoxamine 5'-phosphate oxidase superfamily)
MEYSNLNEDWTANVVGRMHKFRITNVQLAEECNYSAAYLSTVLNGKKEFESEESKQKTMNIILDALNRLESKIVGQADADSND